MNYAKTPNGLREVRPSIFPNVNSFTTDFMYRVPMDDTHTLHVFFTSYAQDPTEGPQEKVPYYIVPSSVDTQGNPIWAELDNNGGQDAMAWVAQGQIVDRTKERLGESDRGVLMYRELLRQQIRIVEDGGEPMNVFRDPAKNVCIAVPPRDGSPLVWEGPSEHLMNRVTGPVQALARRARHGGEVQGQGGAGGPRPLAPPDTRSLGAPSRESSPRPTLSTSGAAMTEAAFPQIPLEFGIFDWIEWGEAPLNEVFEAKLKLMQHAEKCGFACYHVAEHHGTPLSINGSPGLFLASAAQRTERIRLSPLTYCLPWHNPYRLYNEICMLDQLSKGRLEVGVSRGVVPHRGADLRHRERGTVPRDVAGGPRRAAGRVQQHRA